MSHGNILEREINNALKEMNRPSKELFISGIAAGLNVSFGALFMGMVPTFSPSFPSPLVKQFLMALASFVGFLFVVLGQTELFTAHTTMGVLPVLDGRAPRANLGELWGVVYVSNLVGCVLFAGLISLLGPPLDIAEPAVFGALVPLPGVGRLPQRRHRGMAHGVGDVARRRQPRRGEPTPVRDHRHDGNRVRAVSPLPPRDDGGAVGDVHGQGVTLGEFGHFLVWTTLGNAVGGTAFVALVNYGHVALSEEYRARRDDADEGGASGDD